ncbi:MAG: divalent metal cation transporter [Gammaproteobacteria bacterium]|nr:divalent metal cation transporter [Gammaproteobacteria bacterium]MDP2139411.1 divalent metal cation transporter [Gammaproteobacteria bacterium]MDP2346247.1 divalent metal cation transporter [Gammaproteobacteria bacterium]
MEKTQIQSRLRTMGPGLIMSSAAVGGSHLVASTQAGALFGWQLLWVILLVNLLKYPFFRFGVQYTLDNNESLIRGYQRKSRNYLIGFTALNVVAAVVNTAGVLILTASLLQYFIPWSLSLTTLCWLLLAICLTILLAGHYKLLDRLSKVIMLVLTLTTIIAVVIAWQNGPTAPADFVSPSPWQLSAIAFLVAMIGWMPVPIELSAISSLWTRSKLKLTKVTLSQALFDFNVGYGVAVGLALVFVALGALVQHGANQEIALASAAFAQQLVSMYAATIGEWSRLLVAGIAFLCMFGTTLAVMDGYARTLDESFYLLKENEQPRTEKSLSIWIVLQALAGMAIILFFQSSLAPMLGFAMTMAFVTTPFFAWLNFDLVRGRLSGLMNAYAWIGMIYLSAFSIAYIVWWSLF